MYENKYKNLISARLIKNLEEKGFSLKFPSYESDEKLIIQILKEDNERLELALPLLLQHEFDYEKIKKNISKKELNILNKAILISKRIFDKENIINTHLKKIIRKYSLKEKITKEEFEYNYISFKESRRNKESNAEKKTAKQLTIRGKLNLQKALSTIYALGKLRIMDKIFNHEPLTNSELKYYYRSIRPLTLAILNENMRKYIRIIETSRKRLQD
tara:strand:- start:530 stop:1177 length:648 start_codon:yes stop_codon:yes gene_type:complete